VIIASEIETLVSIIIGAAILDAAKEVHPLTV
jgi:hypothetical protein